MLLPGRSIPVYSPKPKICWYLIKLSIPIDSAISINATLQELAIASIVLFCSMSRPKMASDIIIPHMKITTAIHKISSPVSAPVSNPAATVNGFIVDPGSNASLTQKFLHDTTQYASIDPSHLSHSIASSEYNAGQISWFVQIKIRVRGLSQNLSGIRIHDHDRCILATGHSTSCLLRHVASLNCLNASVPQYSAR